jgi:hypothetical protein
VRTLSFQEAFTGKKSKNECINKSARLKHQNLIIRIYLPSTGGGENVDKKDGIIVVLVLIIIVLLVLSASGNSTTTSTKNNSSSIPIELDNTPSVSQDQGSLSIGGMLKNNGNVDYNNVKLCIQGYNQDDKLLYEKNTTVAGIKAGEDADYNINVDYNGENISYAKVTVLSATPAS